MGRESRRRARVDPTGQPRTAAPETTLAMRTGRSRRKPGKMSEQLIAVAEPWTSRLDRPPSREEITLIYGVTSRIWNASRQPNAAAEPALAETRRLTAATLPWLPPQAISELVTEIFDRARRLYPDDPRIIADTTVEDAGDGRCEVIVATLRTE